MERGTWNVELVHDGTPKVEAGGVSESCRGRCVCGWFREGAMELVRVIKLLRWAEQFDYCSQLQVAPT